METKTTYTLIQSVTRPDVSGTGEMVEICEEFEEVGQALTLASLLASPRDRYEIDLERFNGRTANDVYRLYVEEVEWQVDADGEIRCGVTVDKPFWYEYGPSEHRDAEMEGEDDLY